MLNRKLNKKIYILLISFLSVISSFAGINTVGFNDPINIINRDSLTIINLKDSSLELTTEDENLIEPEIPLHQSMDDFIDDYTESHDELFEKIKETKSNYFNIIDKIFQSHNIPVELKYMAVVESKLKTNAVSGVGAVGLWQFMPTTAKTYGLKITSKYDERQNLWKSTDAAAKYLKLLYGYFEDWLLVVAAYNGGPGTVFNAIKKSGSRNFWKLQYFLPKETRLHVKRFIATHYYFEGTGSLATLGKAESEMYLKELDEFKSKNLEIEGTEDLPDTDETNPVSAQLIAITQNENDLFLILKK